MLNKSIHCVEWSITLNMKRIEVLLCSHRVRLCVVSVRVALR